MFENITGCILAGGRSSRFGSDKALIEINGTPIIGHLINLFSGQMKDIMIISNRHDKSLFGTIPVYEDAIKFIGPLGGILTALINSRNDKVFIISCDLPFLTADFIEYICGYPAKRPIVLPVTQGIIQPLCGIYSKECIPIINGMIGEGSSGITPNEPKQWKYSPLVLIEAMKSELIDVDKTYIHYEEKLLYNINHPEDYEKIKREIGMKSLPQI